MFSNMMLQRSTIIFETKHHRALFSPKTVFTADCRLRLPHHTTLSPICRNDFLLLSPHLSCDASDTDPNEMTDKESIITAKVGCFCQAISDKWNEQVKRGGAGHRPGNAAANCSRCSSVSPSGCLFPRVLSPRWQARRWKSRRCAGSHFCFLSVF